MANGSQKETEGWAEMSDRIATKISAEKYQNLTAEVIEVDGEWVRLRWSNGDEYWQLASELKQAEPEAMN